MSTTERQIPKAFSYKGWNRLIGVLAVAYWTVIILLMTFVDGGLGWLAPNKIADIDFGRFIPAMILPPLAVGLLIHSAIWVYRGFRSSS
jgi:hypothetical protein